MLKSIIKEIWYNWIPTPNPNIVIPRHYGIARVGEKDVRGISYNSKEGYCDIQYCAPGQPKVNPKIFRVERVFNLNKIITDYESL